MVYEKKCSECGKVMDFGGRELRDDPPENAIVFDDQLYCKECVKRFVEFGTGNLKERIDKIEENLEQVAYEVGLKLDEI